MLLFNDKPKSNRKLFFFIVLQSTLLLWAQDITPAPPPPPAPPSSRPVAAPERRQGGGRDNAVVLHLVTRVLDQDKTEVWNQDVNKVTIPGRPVGLKIVGDNVIVAVQFTAYPRRNGGVLVAQGQIWIEVPGEGIQYRTTMQTISLEYGEQVFFFPLGANTGANAHIEIQVDMTRYTGIPVATDSGANDSARSDAPRNNSANNSTNNDPQK
jgi:hypothetical protein